MKWKIVVENIIGPGGVTPTPILEKKYRGRVIPTPILKSLLFGETDRYYHKMRLHCNAYVYPCEWYDYNTVYTFMLGNIHFSKNLIFCCVIFLPKIHMG